MIVAYHSVFSMYGFWLPNDPRGSGSDYVANWELFRYGPATKTNSRRSVARLPLPPNWQREAKTALQYPPVFITGRQALAISEGFATAAGEGPYRIYACAILPEHVHLVIGASPRRVRQVVGHFKSRATHTLKEQRLWNDDRPLWGEHGWNVYLESVAAVERAIRYVNDNPLKEGKKRQNWSFVVPFVEHEAIQTATAAEAARAAKPARRVGGAALKSRDEARRNRHGEKKA
ncbi:MAG: transposase [Thermoguttaceae bacterium]